MTGTNNSLARDMAILEEASNLERSLDVSVKISFSEALHVVVNDLVKKYKSCVQRNDEENAAAFKTVLLYYVSQDEFELLIAEKDV